MIESSAARPPAWFRMLAILGLAWNLVGVGMYLQKVGIFGDPFAGLNDAERALAESVPAWVTGAFALAVFAGLVGALALVLSKRLARPLLIVSLLAVLVQSNWILLVSDARAVHGLTAVAMSLLVVLIAALLVWLADAGAKRGWLT